MIHKISDFHTHTSYCDGKNSPFEMADTAYELGFTHYGFSGHGYTHFDTSYCMAKDALVNYRLDVEKIKEQYEGKMCVLCGLEQDLFSEEPAKGYDYIIGSMHYICYGNEYLPIDFSKDKTVEIIRGLFDGDFDKFAEEYYRQLSSLAHRVNADIIGHFDLITKYKDLFDFPIGDRYYEASFSCLDKLLKHSIPFEINVGAISRGYRTTPYPDKRILEYIFKQGGEIVINGDTHSKDNLGKNLDIGISVAKEAGFTERVIFTECGFVKIPL